MDPLDLISQGKIKRFFRATRKLTQPVNSEQWTVNSGRWTVEGGL